MAEALSGCLQFLGVDDLCYGIDVISHRYAKLIISKAPYV
jgi:hypothetical protein